MSKISCDAVNIRGLLPGAVERGEITVAEGAEVQRFAEGADANGDELVTEAEMTIYFDAHQDLSSRARKFINDIMSVSTCEPKVISVQRSPAR